MLIRAENEAAHVVAEAALPTEAELHDALTNHPQLIPEGDIGLGDTLVVGRESGLAAGYADLVLLDDRGRLCIVEVKNEGNPDTRRVVAQLLDYAASLWVFPSRSSNRGFCIPSLSGPVALLRCRPWLSTSEKRSRAAAASTTWSINSRKRWRRAILRSWLQHPRYPWVSSACWST